MLMRLDTSWLLMAISLVTVLSFFFGSAMNAIMREDGFGAFGNMIVITTGFFLGILLANNYGIAFRDLTQATATGLSSAFIVLASLAMIKAVLNRM